MNNATDHSPAVIVGLGEILWDVFPDRACFGGAPANFSCCAAGLSAQAEVYMLSGVGDDNKGRAALDELRRFGVRTDAVQLSQHPTGKVDIKLDDAGKPTYAFAENTAWDNLVWSADLDQLAARTASLCFGTLGQRAPASRDVILRFVNAVADEAPKIFDINIRRPFFSDAVVVDSLNAANVLKLSDEELPEVCRISDVAEDAPDALVQIANRWKLRLVAMTRGAEGAVLVSGQEAVDVPGTKVQVADTVGAGDAFTAVLCHCLLRNIPLHQTALKACEVAAWMCTQPGATNKLPTSLMFD